MCGILAYSGNELRTGHFEKTFNTVAARGPDYSILTRINETAILGFHRLAIMDPSDAGNQPFHTDGRAAVCNGEIYNHRQLATQYQLTMKTGSDCEVILPLYRTLGLEEMCGVLDGVFAFSIVDGDRLHFGRDPIGIRPLFIGERYDSSGKKEVVVCSEIKGIPNHFEQVRPVPPGHYGTFNRKTNQLTMKPFYTYDYDELTDISEAEAISGIRDRLFAAVDKRMMSDRPIGCLVSGGVDSSLIAAMVAQHYETDTLHTFNVGLKVGASDRKYARIVANHIGSVHHEVTLTNAEALGLIPDTVRACESFDTTTIRASTMQLAIARYISRWTDIKVIFNGDVIDEASGSYVYFKNAPSNEAYQEESIRLMKEIHLFDVLRADRTISGSGLEARVPFADLDFLKFYMAIPPHLRKPREGAEKYLLRKSFEGLLPEEVLWRPKEAFSDGCSSPEDSWYSIIQRHVEPQLSDDNLAEAQATYAHCPPQTKEQLYYRELFQSKYATRASVIPHFWMPKWCGDGIIDPSARVLTDVYRPSSIKAVPETKTSPGWTTKSPHPLSPVLQSDTGE
jgi:asparagine synthase (glutamine-hydrolysing)